jgi:hypothetical protein
MKTDAGIRSRLWVGASTPQATLLLVIALLYLVPHLCGFPTWPGGPTISVLARYEHAYDQMTFREDHRPIREFIINELSAGRFPFWMSTPILGLPLLEQYEYQIFNPLEWLTYLGADLWWTIVLCGYLYVGGLGIFAICRNIGVDKWAALGGAIAYIAAGYVPMFYTVPSWMVVIPTIPWLLFCTGKILIGPIKPGHFIGLCLCLALLILSGQPQITLCTLWFSAIYAVTLVIWRVAVTGDVHSAAKAVALCFIAAALAIASSLPQIVPFTKFYVSGEVYAGQHLVQGGWHVSLVNLLNPIFPFSMGVGPYYTWTVNPLIRAVPSEDFPLGFYCTGSLLAFIGLFAAFRRHEKHPIRFAFAVATIFTIATIGLYGPMNWPVWPFDFVNLARYTSPILAVFIAVLIGVGLDALARRPLAEAMTASCIIAAGAAMLLGIVALHFSAASIVSAGMLRHIVALNATSMGLAATILLFSFRANPRSGVAALLVFVADVTFQRRYGFGLSADIYRLIPLVVLTIGALFYYQRNAKLQIPIGAFAVLIVTGWIYHATTQVVASNAFASPLTQQTAGHRVASSVDAYSSDYGVPRGVIAMASRNPIVFRRLQEFLFAAGSGSTTQANGATRTIRDFRGFSNDAGTPDNEKMQWRSYCADRSRFNALATEILIGDADGAIANIEQYPGCSEGLVKIDLGDDRFIAYRDTKSAPRSYFTKSCLTASDDALTLTRKHMFELTRLPVVEGDGIACSTNLPTKPEALKVADISSEIVDIQTSGLPEGLVVLNDQFFSSWRAYVDNKKVPIYRVNSVARGVMLPADTKSLRFVYEPQIGMLLLFPLAGILFVLIIAFGISRRRINQA